MDKPKPIQDAIDWINLKFPTARIESYETKPLIDIYGQKSQQVEHILVEMQKAIFALQYMGSMPVRERPTTLEDAKAKLSPKYYTIEDQPSKNFATLLQRIVSEDYDPLRGRLGQFHDQLTIGISLFEGTGNGAGSYLRRITVERINPFENFPSVFEGKTTKWINWDFRIDLLTVCHTYRFLLPLLRNPSPVFLMRLSLAETALVDIAAAIASEINRRESPSVLIPASKRSRISRGMTTKNAERRKITIETFNSLTEKTRKMFNVHPFKVYTMFKDQAKRKGVDWGPKGKSPVYETWKKWINEHLSK